MNSQAWDEKFKDELDYLKISEELKTYLRGYCLGIVHKAIQDERLAISDHVERMADAMSNDFEAACAYHIARAIRNT